MSKALTVKLLLIGLVLLLLLLPLGMLDGLVAERQQRGREVAYEIARSVGQAQLVIGPLLLLDTEQDEQVKRRVNENGFLREIDERHARKAQLIVMPEQLQVTAGLESERRGRGPFNALLYHSEQQLKASFRLPAEPADAAQTGFRITGARLVVALGDQRGIRSLRLVVAGAALAVEPGSGLGWQAQGASAPLSQLPQHGERLAVEVAMVLSGSARLGWLPVANETTISASGDWPHPAFEGSPLPRSHEVHAAGFRADWQVSHLASAAQHLVSRCQQDGACSIGVDDMVAVSLVEPVDRYRMTDRAIKYALLFLSLSFGAVFFLEVLRSVPVHPMQYGLAGLALAMFFLLLLALSEQIGFGIAYLLAALACIALIGTYMSAVLQSRRRGAGFAALLAVLYGLLYCLLRAEDFALLAGALALFALLATVMLASRHVDWRRVGAG